MRGLDLSARAWVIVLRRLLGQRETSAVPCLVRTSLKLSLLIILGVGSRPRLTTGTALIYRDGQRKRSIGAAASVGQCDCYLFAKIVCCGDGR